MRLGFWQKLENPFVFEACSFHEGSFYFSCTCRQVARRRENSLQKFKLFLQAFERLQRVEAFRFENLNCWRQYYIVSKNLSNLLFLANTDSNTDSNMDSNTDSSTVANTDPNADYSTDSNKDTNTEAHTDPDTDSNTDSKAESNIDSNKDSKKDSNTDSNTNPNTDSPMRIRIQICNPRWI